MELETAVPFTETSNWFLMLSQMNLSASVYAYALLCEFLSLFIRIICYSHYVMFGFSALTMSR
jgi:hypothetical protein